MKNIEKIIIALLITAFMSIFSCGDEDSPCEDSASSCEIDSAESDEDSAETSGETTSQSIE